MWIHVLLLELLPVVLGTEIIFAAFALAVATMLDEEVDADADEDNDEDGDNDDLSNYLADTHFWEIGMELVEVEMEEMGRWYGTVMGIVCVGRYNSRERLVWR